MTLPKKLLFSSSGFGFGFGGGLFIDFALFIQVLCLYRSGVHYITKPEGTSAHTTLRQRKAKKSASVG